MYHRRIVDWDDAYANGVNIAGGDPWPDAWLAPSRAFRDSMSAEGRARLGLSYGQRPRNRFDLFMPSAEP